MIFDKYDETKARGKPPFQGKRQRAKEFAGKSVCQSFSPSVFQLAKPRLRLKGRDGPVQTSSSGPPGSMKMITGVPAWLARGTLLVPITIGSVNEKYSVILCVFFVCIVELKQKTMKFTKETQGSQRVGNFNKGRPLALHGKMNDAGGKPMLKKPPFVPPVGGGREKG